MTTTVIGAGIAGLSCAFELVDRGEDLAVLDSGHVGAAASAGNAGWVTPFLSAPRAAPGAFADAMRNFVRPDGAAKMHPHLEPRFVTWALGFLRASRINRSTRGTYALQQLARHANSAYDRLRERGLEIEEHRTGLGVVFQREDNLRKYEQLVQKMHGLGYTGRITRMQGDQMRAFDPAINRSTAGVLHLESERHVRPESVTRALADAVRQRGGTIHEHEYVTRITRTGAGKWRVATDSGQVSISDRVVVAAGFHTKELLKRLRVRVPIEAAKGVSATITGEGQAPAHALKLFEDMVACSPFDDGLRLSGTFDIGDRSTRINDKRLAMIIAQGQRYLENWHPTRADIEWAGHRPTSADDLPIVGEVSGQPGLYLASGHGTLGITLGPITGALAAKELLDGEPQELLQPFRLERFPRWV